MCCSRCCRPEVVLYALEMLEGKRRILLEPAEGELRSSEVPEVMRRVLLCMLEAVEGGFSFEVSKFPLWQFSR